MPKQKINVNEDLNVSIGELFRPKSGKDSTPIETAKKTERVEPHSKDSSNSVIPEPSSQSSEKDTKSNAAKPSTDIKKMISQIGRVSLQHQKAGRGGKTVTLISIGEAKSEVKQNLEVLLKELKKSLGCGGQIEEGKIVLHGEIASRASEWFIKMGAKSVKC